MRKLDRLVNFDARSRRFAAISDPDRDKPIRSYTWACNRWHDQGVEGQCVGYAWTHELAARPHVVSTDYNMATQIYKEAQRLDIWPGEDYEGTSVLAGIKAVQALLPGLIGGYRWAFGLEDLVRVLGYKGPAVLGVNWYSDMFDTDVDGFVHASGEVVGGHAILARGVKLVWNAGTGRTFADLDIFRSYILLRNSWGQGWGINGDAKISLNDMNNLLHQEGEVCIPVMRGIRNGIG